MNMADILAAGIGLPEPLTPADCDMRAFGFMPLEVIRLRDSKIASHDDAEVFRVSVLLWCASWHQVPAGSIPNDSKEIAKLAGFGRDVKAWEKLRKNGGLYGWILCRDGRYYHPIVAEKALESMDKQKTNSNRTRAATLARLARAAQRDDDVTLDVTSERDVGRDDGRNVDQGKGREGKGRKGKGLKDGVASQPVGQMPDDAPPKTRELTEQAKAILAFLNEKAGKSFPDSSSNVGIIVARMREGFKAAQLRQVVAMRVRMWKDDEKMREYLRPATLFGMRNFSQYVGELVEVPADKAGAMP